MRHDTEEHKELERTMKELEGCAADDPRFAALVSELRDQLHHHATDEETEQFPELRARVPREKLVQMREQDRRHLGVVGEHVGLGGLGLGIEDLVEVAQLEGMAVDGHQLRVRRLGHARHCGTDTAPGGVY